MDGALILDDMGLFRIDVAVENPRAPGPMQLLGGVIMDTGAELSWFPAAALNALGIARQKELSSGKPTARC